MREVFRTQETEAVLLVDASNAFNSLNCQAALRNIQNICPALSKVLINTYYQDIQLFIDGDILFSQEGKRITAPLVALILQQSCQYTSNAKNMQLRAKWNACAIHRRNEANAASELKTTLPTQLQRAMTVSSEKGASSWLTTLPIDEHGFALHKGAFRDALCLRCGWKPSQLPNQCICGKQFTIEHALNCAQGGFPSIQHNDVTDITADLLSEVCHGVGIEPHLQPVTGEELRHRTAIHDDDARLDVVAEGFWGRGRQRAFFDVRVFNPFVQSYQNTSMAQCYHRNEAEKRRSYDEKLSEHCSHHWCSQQLVAWVLLQQ